VLDALKEGPAMPAAELAHLAGVGTSVIKTMARSDCWNQSSAR
jgi:primosomal protein N' (replication factor Y)